MCCLTQTSGALDVDDVVGPGGLRAESVVDGHADPAPRHQLVHHRLALLALFADDPSAPVDVHHHRRVRRRDETGTVDVEAVLLAPVPPVVDVAGDLDGAGFHGDGPGDPPPPAPCRCGRLGGDRKGVAAHFRQGGRGDVGGPQAGDAQADEADPTGHRDGQPEPPGPTVQGTELDEDGRGDHLPDDVLERELARPAGEGETDDGQGLTADGPIGERDGDGPDNGDGQDRRTAPLHHRPNGSAAPVCPGGTAFLVAPTPDLVRGYERGAGTKEQP